MKPLHPGAVPTCPRCHGQGFQVRRRGEHAGAARCSCVRACPTCRDTGWVATGEGRRAPRRRCACLALPHRIQRFDEAGIPARHAHSSLSTFRPSTASGPAFKKVAGWLRDFEPGGDNRGLILHGKVGRGKTHLAVALVRELVFRHGVSARFVEFSHLLADLKSGFDRGQGPARRLDPLVAVEVLVIDELGKGRNTEFEGTVVDELVSRRYNAGRTILATTNYAPGPATGVAVANAALPDAGPNLVDRIGDRVYSRLREMCDFCEVAGDDHRELLRAERG